MRWGCRGARRDAEDGSAKTLLPRALLETLVLKSCREWRLQVNPRSVGQPCPAARPPVPRPRPPRAAATHGRGAGSLWKRRQTNSPLM